MAVTITVKGTDLKVDKGTEINYYPVDDMRQRVIGTKVELYDNGKLSESFDETDFVSPSGTAEQIGDGISDLVSSIGALNYAAGTSANITDVSSEVIAANPSRKALIIVNSKTGEDCWISINGTPVVDEDLKLKKEASIFLPQGIAPTSLINAICKSGKSTDLTIFEAS